MHTALVLYGNCTGDVVSFDRSARTQIQMLMFFSAPWKATGVPARCCHRRGSPWGAGRDNSSSTSWDVSARPPAPRAKGAGAGGAAQHSEKVTTQFSWWHLIPSSPEGRASGATCEPERHDKHLEKRMGPAQTYIWQLCLTPCSLQPKSTHDVSWPSDSPRYFSFGDKTVTRGIFKASPCERSTPLSKHSAFGCLCAVALLPC